MGKERTPKLAIYARTSVDKDEFKTSIEQQIEEGKKFAIAHNLEYEVFSDKGVSAYKIEDEKDPYYTRDEFKQLMEKISKNVFSDLWVWEASRLSRNDLAMAKIKTSLIAHNVILHTKSQTFDLTKPQDKLNLSILSDFSEYERDLIVERTTRGLHKAINEGKRSFSHFYGYEKAGFENGNFTYKIDERKIEQVKQAYKLFLEGNSLRQITFILEESNIITPKERLKLATKWGRILAHKEYTGYSLNMDGLEIEKQFSNNEIGSLVQLKDKEKFWVKSQVYKEEIISIDDWIICREKLQNYKKALSDKRTNYSVNSSLSTGIVKCYDCGCGYYIYNTATKRKNKDVVYTPYYKHRSFMNNNTCMQNPKTIKKEKLDNIMRFFYIFQSLIFNDRQIKSNEIISALKNRKKLIDEEIKTIRKDIEKFNKLVKIADDKIIENPDLFVEITRQQNIYNSKIKELEEDFNQKETGLINLQKELEENEKLLTFKLSQKQIVEFLFFKNSEEQRNILIKQIEEAKIYNNFIVIKSRDLYFIFKIDKNEKPEKNEQGKNIFRAYSIPEFLFNGKNDEILSFWARYENNDLDFKKPETQDYLRKLFNWKDFKVSDENMDLDFEIKLPDNSTVIYFDESETLDDKRIKARARRERYKERLKNNLVNHRK